MWDNYRITVKDALGYPTEYYYDAYDGDAYNGATIYTTTYRRTPHEMRRSPDHVAPHDGAHTRFVTTAVGSRGVTTGMFRKRSDGPDLTLYQAASFSALTRLPGEVWNGFRFDEVVSRNSQGKPTQVKLSKQAGSDYLVSLSYESNGVDVDTITRPLNGVTKTLIDCNYFANRDLQSVTDAAGRTLSYLWLSDGRIQKITDSATGDYIEFLYDSNKRPASIKVNGKTAVTTSHDMKGNLLQTVGPDGRLIQYQYDNLNRLTRELRPDATFTAYDWACCFIESVRFGRVVNGVNRVLRRSVYAHDVRGLPVSTTDTDGRITAFEYDHSRRLVALTDPKGQVTRWIYNTADLLVEKKYPDGTKESLGYDDLARLEYSENRRGQQTTIAYHAVFGGVQLLGTPEETLTITPDTWGRPQTITQSATSSTVGGTWTLAHDLLGRVTVIDGPWTDDTISWSYNDAARSVTRTAPGGFTEAATTDALGRIASIANPLGTFTHAYDDTATTLSSVLMSVTHSGGFNTAFTWHGDAFDRVLATISSTKPGGGLVGKHTYADDTLGQITSGRREAPLPNPTGPTRQFESKVWYDLASQVSSLIHTPLAGSSVAESGHHYVYDLAGNIASKQVESPSLGATMTAYGHNELNQITGIGGTAGSRKVTVRGGTSEPSNVQAKPSTSGNWTSARMLEGDRFEADLNLAAGANQLQIKATDGSGNTSNYTYSLALASAPAAASTHDLDGNLTIDGIRSYEWDNQNRLIKITWDAGSNKTTEFKYNALGQRAERIDKTGSTETAHHYYLYDGIRLLCRYQGGTATDNIDRRYFDQGEQRKNGANWDSYYYTRDHLGSVREVLASNGTLVARYDYDPYGKRSAQYEAPTYAKGCDLGYTGHSRKAACIEELLPDYQGNLQTDAYAGYTAWADGREGIALASCWAHARREFHEALKIGQRLAAGPVAIIARLYQIETALRESRATADRRTEVRRQQSTPVLEILKGELLALRQRPEILPKSRLSRAIDYTLALWDRLLLFVERGEIEIDNNLTENGIRPTAVGKKNWLFVGSETTGQRAAIIYTMVECAKRHGHNPEAWLTDVLERLPAMTNRDDLSVLLPSKWQPPVAGTNPIRQTCPA